MAEDLRVRRVDRPAPLESVRQVLLAHRSQDRQGLEALQVRKDHKEFKVSKAFRAH